MLAVVLFTSAGGGIGTLVGCASDDDGSLPGPDAGDASVTRDGSTSAGDGGAVADAGDGGHAGTRGCGPTGAVSAAPTYVFVGPDAGGCTVAQIDLLSVDCLESDGGAVAATACSAFRASAANAPCLDCIYGPSATGGASDPASLQRPLYTVDLPASGGASVVFASVAGCIAAYDPSAVACAQTVAAATACELSQCSACGTGALDDCLAAAGASGGPCADLQAQSASCTAPLFAASAGPVRTCGSLVDPTDGELTADLTSYLFVACGGADSSSDEGKGPSK
jgi:hypothetical protein